MSKRADYMTPEQREQTRGLARRHDLMRNATAKRNKDGRIVAEGVARPGKTAQDKARRRTQAE